MPGEISSFHRAPSTLLICTPGYPHNDHKQTTTIITMRIIPEISLNLVGFIIYPEYGYTVFRKI